MKEITISSNNSCGLANWLFWIFSNKDYIRKEDVIVCHNPDKKYILESFDKLGIIYRIDNSIEFNNDYKQDFNLFDLDILKNQLIIPNEIKSNIYKKIPDIDERVVIHIRRGDYLSDEYKMIFRTPTLEYILGSYIKYYDEMKVVIISDDKDWCINHFSNVFNDCVICPFDDALCDLFLLSLSKANICSASSFSMMGTYLNKNKDCVIPYPYYKQNDSNIVPSFSKRYNMID